MTGAIVGYSSSIVYKLTNLRYVFLYQVWLFTTPKFSWKFIQRADVKHTVCFTACLPEIWAKCVEGHCRNFFLVYFAYMIFFFSLNFPLHEFFFCSSPAPPPPPPPPHNVSNGPSLMELKLWMEPCVSCIYLTYCMEYVWKSSLWIGIFQRATQRARILLTDNIQSGGSYSVNYY